MSDGPNFEKLFRDCQCLNGKSDLDTIVKYLHFTSSEGVDGVSPYLAHYLPMLPDEVADEFVKKPKKEEKIADKPITETVVTEVKKRGRLAKKA